MTHVDPHAFPPDDGSDHSSPHPDDGWGTAGDDHTHQAHGHAHSDWEHGHAHLDQGGLEQDHQDSADLLAADGMWVEADGSLALHAVHHGHVEVGDFVDVRLPNGDHVIAQVTATNPTDQTYRALVSASDAHSLQNHLLGGAAEAGAHIAFEALMHAAEESLCHGEVIGTDGQHCLLGGADAGAGASGAPVFNDAGHLVGQVVGFDPGQGVNLMVPADNIMSGLADFASWIL